MLPVLDFFAFAQSSDRFLREVSVNADDTSTADDSFPSCDTGRRLKFLRELAGLSQRELAKRAKLTNSSISTIEQGQVSPSIQSLSRILSAIPINLADFFAFQFPSPIPLPGSLQSGGKAQSLVLTEQSASAFIVAPVDISGAVLKGELVLLIGDQRLAFSQGETFVVAAGQLFRCINATHQELRVFVCSPVKLIF